MKAKVKENSKFKTVTSCAGIEFTQKSWTTVPIGTEEEALQNPYLEIEPDITSEPDKAESTIKEEKPVTKTPKKEPTKKPVKRATAKRPSRSAANAAGKPVKDPGDRTTSPKPVPEEIRSSN